MKFSNQVLKTTVIVIAKVAAIATVKVVVIATVKVAVIKVVSVHVYRYKWLVVLFIMLFSYILGIRLVLN